MTKDLGLPSGWKGRMYQSFGKLIDWQTTINIDLSEYGEGEGIRVLIIGSGLDNHMDLNRGGGYNLSTINPYTLDDFNGHSTFVAGIVAGNGNHYVRGIAPKAEICVVKIIDKNEIAEFRVLETALLWAKDNFSSVVLVDLELYNTMPLTVKKAISSLEKSGVPVFINDRKNDKYDFTKYETDILHESCWIDNWYKGAENIDSSLPIATGLAALIKGKYPNFSTDEIYNRIDNILFPKKSSANPKRTVKNKKDEEESE